MPVDRVCCPTCHVPAPHGCDCWKDDEPEHEDPDALIAAEFVLIIDRPNPDGRMVKKWWKP